jgi:threonine synthase
MKYLSTRGDAPVLGFNDVLLEGLARDGGLYVPETIPHYRPQLNAVSNDGPRSYVEVAQELLARYIVPSPPDDSPPVEYPDQLGTVRDDGHAVARLVAEAYATFDHPEVCPLVPMGENLWVQELWHGPTLAFKDVALQLVGRLMDHELARRGERRTIVVATSGDTGSAAIAACVGRANLDIVVLHPAGRTSEVQRRQMTTVDEPNVHNVAVEGTFDDCQDLVKALFAEEAYRDEVALGAMNSINWGRVVAQIVYYVTGTAAVAPDYELVTFAVPTGNFGNILAGWYAKHMGTPIDRLLIASNRNDILARWVATGALSAESVVPTLSPSMDIQVSSNHERLLFELLGRDGRATAELMGRFRATGHVEAPGDSTFAAARLDDGETLAEMSRVYAETGYLADPHTAVGIGAARRLRRNPDERIICLSTAHPAKFPDAVERATGIRPPLPARMADLFDLPERYDTLPADLSQVQAYVRTAVRPSSVP